MEISNPNSASSWGHLVEKREESGPIEEGAEWPKGLG